VRVWLGAGVLVGFKLGLEETLAVVGKASAAFVVSPIFLGLQPLAINTSSSPNTDILWTAFIISSYSHHRL
jgi:hypothetical protein